MTFPAKVLVTGASGFIGRHVVSALAARGCDVIAVGRSTPDDAPGTWLELDMAVDMPPAEIADGVAAVVNLATPNDRDAALSEAVRVNVDAVARLCTWAERAGAKHLVHVSTTSVYALETDASVALDEDAPQVDAAAPPYAFTKAWGDALVRGAGGNGVEHVTVLRPAQVYGPGQRESGTIAELAETVTAGGQVYIAGDDGHRLSPVYVDDVVAVILHALETPTTATWNVGGPDVLTEADVARKMAEHFDAVLAFVDMAEDTAYSFAADSSALETAWTAWPRTAFSDGLQATWPDGDYD